MRTLTLTEATPIEFAANESGPRTFSMTAYTGDAVDTIHGRAVVDLAGLQVGSHKKPALESHDRKRIVGYSNEIANTGSELHVRGKVSQKTQAAKDVMELADEDKRHMAYRTTEKGMRYLSIYSSLKSIAVFPQEED